MGAVAVIVFPSRDLPTNAAPALRAYEKLAKLRHDCETQYQANEKAFHAFETEIWRSEFHVPPRLALDLSEESTARRTSLTKEYTQELERLDDQIRDLMLALVSSSPSIVAKTDADGRFAVKLHSGDWVLAQSEQKLPGGNDEHYIWAIQAPEGEDPLIISNDCVLNTSDAIGLFLARATGQAPAGVSEHQASAKADIVEWCKSSLDKARVAGESALRDAEKARAAAESARAAAESARVAAEREAERVAAEREAARIAQVRREKEVRAETARLAEERERKEAEHRAAVEAATAAELAKAEKARTPSAGETWHSSLLNVDLVSVAPGTYQMGSSAKGMFTGNERPVTTVRLTEPFWIAPTAVTQAQFEAVMGFNRSNTKGANNPVEKVSWQEALEFCRLLTSREHLRYSLRPEFEITLPTEAQREYACRAGSTKEYEGDLSDISWHGSVLGSSHPVALKRPNAWGLYDMQGNVYEWCLDWYGAYPGGSVVNPTGPKIGTQRVVRGGAWNCPAGFCRSSFRYKAAPDGTALNIGFRVVVIRTTKP